jgi:hypothetical protein
VLKWRRNPSVSCYYARGKLGSTGEWLVQLALTFLYIYLTLIAPQEYVFTEDKVSPSRFTQQKLESREVAVFTGSKSWSVIIFNF